MKTSRLLALPLVALLATGGMAEAQTVAPPATADTADALRPGDVIRVRVWREPDLSGDFTVDETGHVVIPKLGVLAASSGSPAALKDSMMTGYATYLRNPSVEVTFLRRVTIHGAVRNPGLYTVSPSVTVVDAIAMAGGVNGSGRSDRVELVRGTERIPIKITGTMTLADTPLRSGDQLVVPQRSWLARNPWLVAAAISTTAGFIRLAIK